MNTLRDVNRVINTFQFRYNLLYQETAFEDMVAVTTLEVLEPKLYRWVSCNKDALCGGYLHSLNSIGNKKINASRKDYLEYVLDQLSSLDDISYRAMMGEYIIYYQGKIIGGIYDDRFLVKPTESAMALMPDVARELPYEGAKEMLLVEDIDDRDSLKELLNAMVDELPVPKKKK